MGTLECPLTLPNEIAIGPRFWHLTEVLKDCEDSNNEKQRNGVRENWFLHIYIFFPWQYPR